jgi:hypothetical protein
MRTAATSRSANTSSMPFTPQHTNSRIVSVGSNSTFTPASLHDPLAYSMRTSSPHDRISEHADDGDDPSKWSISGLFASPSNGSLRLADGDVSYEIARDGSVFARHADRQTPKINEGTPSVRRMDGDYIGQNGILAGNGVSAAYYEESVGNAGQPRRGVVWGEVDEEADKILKVRLCAACVCVCVCVFVCVCVGGCVYMYVYVCVYIYIHIYIYFQTYIRTVHIGLVIYLYKRIYPYNMPRIIYMCVCLSVCLSVYTHTHTHTYIYIHTHTHITCTLSHRYIQAVYVHARAHQQISYIKIFT